MKMKAIAIIPARGRSKRIPFKNIKSFCGEPIIYYSIKAALNSGCFHTVMVSTDDQEIAGIAQKCGAQVPFFRSEKAANDFAVLADVIEEVLAEYLKINEQFDYGCCILPTAPFISEKLLQDSFQLLSTKAYDAVFPVVRFDYPIQRALKMEADRVSMIWPENLNKRSQDLSLAYHDAGLFYWLKVENFLSKKIIFSDNTGAIVLSGLEVNDIDTLEDWQLAEMKYRLLKK